MSNLNISQVGIDLIKSFEGLSLKAYKPVKAETHYTIGYGHYGADVKSNAVITEAKAEELLKGDVKSFVTGVNKLLKVTVNQNQFDALVSFAYNCGLGNLGSSTLLKRVNEKKFAEASQEFGKWVKGADKKPLAGLVRRRKVESELFSKPVKTVTTKKPSSVATKPVAKPTTPKATVKKGKVVGCSVLNVRDSASSKGKVLDTVDTTVTFTILGLKNHWYNVSYVEKGKTKKGYVSSTYVKLI